MIEYLKIIYFYKSTLFTVIRLLFLFFLSSLISFEIARHEFPNLLIFLLLLFIILDIFVIFKIGHIRPKLKISENDQKDIFKSFTERTLYLFFIKKNIIVLLNALLNLETARFMLDKLNVEKKELPVIEIQTKDLASLSFQVAQKANGKFVTTMDVLTAYLQLVEPQTHLLFNKKIKLEDLLKILIWARFVFGYEENPSKWRINFNGDSVGEWLTTGWTLETKRYSQDLTNKALKKRPLLVGRAEEFKQILEGLSKKENNNIIIVGERGTGKDAIVEALAYKSFCGELPENLNHKRIYELLVGALLAGATNQGELENRIKVIIDEISHAKNVMVYIPEFENVLGASSFGINLSGALMPYLKDGKLPIIAAMTPENYKQYVENKSLLEVFTTIKLEEPNKNTVLEMIFDKAADIEKNNRLSLTYLSIMAAIEFSYRYLGGRKLPGGAISLLEDASSNAFLAGKKRLEEEDVIKTLESKMNISIAEPKTEEKELLLRLEEKLHQRIIDQNEAIFLISESMRRLRTGFISANKPVSFLFLGPTGVGKTETAKALADLYFKGEGNMIRLDMSEYTGEDGVRRLLGAPPGALPINA